MVETASAWGMSLKVGEELPRGVSRVQKMPGEVSKKMVWMNETMVGSAMASMPKAYHAGAHVDSLIDCRASCTRSSAYAV